MAVNTKQVIIQRISKGFEAILKMPLNNSFFIGGVVKQPKKIREYLPNGGYNFPNRGWTQKL